MKCDKLLPIHVPAELCGERTLAEAFDYYDREPVDEAIDELKQKLHDAEMAKDDAEAANAEYREDVSKLKAENERLNRELEHVKNGDCINTCDVVEKHVKEELKAKRALWMARAKRARDAQEYGNYWKYVHFHEKSIFNFDGLEIVNRYYEQYTDGFDMWCHRWTKVEQICIKKAEEYK